MAVHANTFTTYDAVGIREDLSDVIKNISPVDTMFYSSLGEGGADNKKVEWQTDALASAAQNKHLEGDQETAAAITPTTRIYNMTQIQKKSFQLSNTEETVKKAGRKSEKSYQTALKSKELSRDVEWAFLQEVRADGADDSERSMRGIINWIVTNIDKAGDATLNANGTITGGTARDLNETIFKGVLQACFNSGGNPSVCYLSAYQKGVVSGWANTSNYRTAVENKKLPATVDVYVSDFGNIVFKPHRIMPTTQLIILDKAHQGKKGTLRNTHRQQLAITGDKQDWMIRVEHTLRDLAEAAHGRITNLTTS